MHKEVEIEEEIDGIPDPEKEISKITDRYPVLEHGEILQLFKKRDQARLAEQKLIESNGSIPPEEKSRLSETIIQGRQALNLIVLHNLRLIFNKAGIFNRTTNIPFPDLFHEGITGLIDAAEKFNPSLGWKFPTYAVWWIDKAIHDYVQKNQNKVYLPKLLRTKQARLSRAIGELKESLKREPTEDEIVKRSKLPKKKIAEINLIPSNLNILPLDSPLEVEDGTVFLYEATADPDSEFESEIIDKNQVAGALLKIPAKEALIISLYFGLSPNSTALQSFRTVGQIIGCTGENCRYHFKKGIKHLKEALK